jgi:hypothetical protein
MISGQNPDPPGTNAILHAGFNQGSKAGIKMLFHKFIVFGFLFSIFPSAPLPLPPEKLPKFSAYGGELTRHKPHCGTELQVLKCPPEAEGTVNRIQKLATQLKIKR